MLTGQQKHAKGLHQLQLKVTKNTRATKTQGIEAERGANGKSGES